MPKSAAAPKPAPTPARGRVADVPNIAESRVERIARELDAIRAEEKELATRKEAIGARLLAAMKRDGAPDAEGKIRYATSDHTFVVIKGTNVYTSKPKMVTALQGHGLTPKQIAGVVKACVKETTYEYVGVYKAKAEEDTVEVAS